jgi:endo-1,4-beta-D-glucanase Y
MNAFAQIDERSRPHAITLLPLFIALFIASVAQAQRFPFGAQHQPYRPGALVPTDFTRAQLNQHVAAYYDQWKSRWLKADSVGDGWRVLLDPTGTTVSEGQGYGMVIVAAMAGHDPQARQIFDGLWEFRRVHPSSKDPRLMDWKVPLATGNNSAFDGDADIAYGLLMAHAQWGSDGDVDYLAEAQNVIAGIRGSTIGPESKLPLLGDWVNPNGANHSQWTTRSSDFMPGHFRAFGRATNDAAYWSSVTNAVQAVITDIQANESAATGLLPDFIRLAGAAHDPQPAPAGFLEGDHDGHYWYNAGRDPWRLGVDAILNDDPTTLAQAQKLSAWARTSTGGDPNNIRGGYRLDGTPLNTWSDHFFIAPLAVAAMTGTTAADQQWLNSVYQRVYQAHNPDNYYADAVTLQSLLAVTGNFWDPTQVTLQPPNPADFDDDGDVDVGDLNRWILHFGTLSGNLADADDDGDADGADLLTWQRNLGAGAPMAAAAGVAIGEPTTAPLGLAAALLIALWSR